MGDHFKVEGPEEDLEAKIKSVTGGNANLEAADTVGNDFYCHQSSLQQFTAGWPNQMTNQ